MAFRSLLSLCALASQALAPQGTLVTCHTAVEGEECYDIVVWAMTTGIRDRPEWYPGLDASSTFREFQQFHYDHPEYRVLQCSPPCPEADGTCCCVATNATQPQCYNDILWALTVGIHSNPEWYPGLTANSSWVEFQSYVAGQDDRCGLPCVDQSSQCLQYHQGGGDHQRLWRRDRLRHRPSQRDRKCCWGVAGGTDFCGRAGVRRLTSESGCCYGDRELDCQQVD